MSALTGPLVWLCLVLLAGWAGKRGERKCHGGDEGRTTDATE